MIKYFTLLLLVLNHSLSAWDETETILFEYCKSRYLELEEEFIEVSNSETINKELQLQFIDGQMFAYSQIIEIIYEH